MTFRVIADTVFSITHKKRFVKRKKRAGKRLANLLQVVTTTGAVVIPLLYDRNTPKSTVILMIRINTV